jgi:hypothetical protein
MRQSKTHCTYQKNSRKAQLQMGETIAVVIIVIVLLFLGITFWNRINSSGTEALSESSQELSVIEIANTVAELPELKCSDMSVESVKCLDWYKVRAMANNIEIYPETKKYYNDYFKNSKITIARIYPNEDNTTIYDVKLSDQTARLEIKLPVNIRDNVNDVTSYGMIIVEGYYK